MLVTEDGTGLEDATSYIDPASTFAVDYMAAHLWAAAWTAASSGAKINACISATRTLDACYEWTGTRLTSTQALYWPRTGYTIDGYAGPALPKELKMATLEQALALLQRNRTSDTASGSQPVEKIGLGDGAISIDFGPDPTAAPTPTSDMITPFVRRILRPFGFTTGGGMTRIERR